VRLAVVLLYHSYRPLFQIYGRALGCLQERVGFEQLLRRRSLLRVLHHALRDYVLEDGRKCVALGQLRCRLQHNLLQQIQDTLWTCSLIIIVALDAERELSDRKLHQGQADTPHIALNSVRASLNSLRSHVGTSPNEGVSHAIFQFTAHTKVAELDLPSAVDQNVRRLDVAVHNAVGLVQVSEPTEHRLRNLSQDVDTHGAEVLRYAIKGADRC